MTCKCFTSQKDLVLKNAPTLVIRAVDTAERVLGRKVQNVNVGDDLLHVLTLEEANPRARLWVCVGLKGRVSRLKSTTKSASNFHPFAPLFRSRRELSGDTWIEAKFVDFKKLWPKEVGNWRHADSLNRHLIQASTSKSFNILNSPSLISIKVLTDHERRG